MKRKSLCILLLTLAVTGCSTTNTNKNSADGINDTSSTTYITDQDLSKMNYIKWEADRIVYNDVQTLAEASDLIVIGTFIDDAKQDISRRYHEDAKKELISDYVSYNTIKVDKVFKGNAADEVTVSQRYAFLEDTNSILTYSELKPMLKGDSYIFFLGFDESNNTYYVVGDSDGRYPVPKSGTADSSDESYGVISENALSKNKALYQEVLKYLNV